jgi:glucose-1-phosphate thymidylyltransferase
MKGLILSGGHGTRLRPITFSQQKQLIPVANKPILFYCIEDLINAGIKTIGIVVGPNKEQVMDAVKSVDWGAEIEFIPQDYPRGLAHAVKVSKDFLGDDKFVMYLGDNLLKGGSRGFINDFARSAAAASLLITKVDNPQDYGQALIDEREKIIVKLVEKPRETLSNLTLVGVYGLTPVIFEAINNIKPSWRNQLEITDALQWLVENGHKVEYRMVEGWWKDTGRPEDILEANHLVLDELKPESKGKVENSVIKGRVSIGKNSTVKDNSVIDGPAIVGENCAISNAYIGPYTSIGNGCQITSTEIENSIVMEGTKITDAGKIVESLIGKNATIEKSDGFPRGGRFIIGDSSMVRT